LASVLLTWVPRPPDAIRPVVNVINMLTLPVFRVVRPLIPPIRIGGMALDLSAIVIFILLALIQNAICGV
jgi:YggT family protein